ncbi:MAG TPA: energy transducer TonB [Caulobacteraceae bacterium]|jgi:outer membrane biosynthesis protein TonB
MSGFALPPRRESRVPALIGAALLHLAVLALVLLAPNHLPKPIGSSVPINIVSSAPFTDTRPAVQAPQSEAAAAPTPVPQAPPQPPAPQVAPPAFTQTAPTPPKVQPKPVPTPQPSAKATPQPAQKAFDFNQLQHIIDHARHTTGAAASSAPKGPARPETAPQARPDAGRGVSQSDLVGLQQLLERLWNPNCDVAGGSAVKVQVHFTVDLTGGLLGRPSAGGLEHSSDPVVAAAALRALDAVRQATPYAEPYYGQPITVNFDAKEACAKR